MLEEGKGVLDRLRRIPLPIFESTEWSEIDLSTVTPNKKNGEGYAGRNYVLAKFVKLRESPSAEVSNVSTPYLADDDVDNGSHTFKCFSDGRVIVGVETGSQVIVKSLISAIPWMMKPPKGRERVYIAGVEDEKGIVLDPSQETAWLIDMYPDENNRFDCENISDPRAVRKIKKLLSK